jgi:hypothetical protein
LLPLNPLNEVGNGARLGLAGDPREDIYRVKPIARRSLDFDRLSAQQVWLVLPLLERLNSGGNQREARSRLPLCTRNPFVDGYFDNDDAFKVFGERLRWIDWIYAADQMPLHHDLQNPHASG